MKHIVFITVAFLSFHFAARSQVTVHCPASCRPVLSCNACWESIQQAVNNGCGITTGNQLAGILNGDLNIYPNPSDNKRFMIDNKNNLIGTIDILDLRGKVITNFDLNGETLYIYEGELAPGVYLVQLTLTGSNVTINKKLIVQ